MSDSPMMISALKVCPKCGAELPFDAPEGGCAGCLLESGLNLLAQEAETFALPRSEHATSSARLAEVEGEWGDYELMGEVGGGGRREVLRARSASRRRRVA